MLIHINEQIRIELIEEKHTSAIFEMVDNNRQHLRSWLPFEDRMQTVEFTRNFVNGTMMRNQKGIEHAFVVFYNDTMVGRVGLYKIEAQNRIGEIGYWIIENSQSKGIITLCCQGLMAFGFKELQLNRIEIKCGTENAKSIRIPERLKFTTEGIIRQGELLFGNYIDLNIYSLLQSEWIEN